MIVAGVVAVALVGLARSDRAQGASTPPPPGYQDVQFGPTVYRIPYEKYNVGIQPYDPARDHAAFFFSLILPDLAPSTSDPAEVASWGTGTGWHRQLHILVEYGRDYISQQQQMLNAFSQSESMKKMTEDDARRAGKPVKHIFKYMTADHFDTLANGCRLYHGYAIAADTMMVCGSGASMLEQTPEIHRMLISLLDSFRQRKAAYNRVDA